MADELETTLKDLQLMRVLTDGQPIGPIRPSLKRDLIASVDDPSMSDAQFREAVRLALRNPWFAGLDRTALRADR